MGDLGLGSRNKKLRLFYGRQRYRGGVAHFENEYSMTFFFYGVSQFLQKRSIIKIIYRSISIIKIDELNSRAVPKNCNHQLPGRMSPSLLFQTFPTSPVFYGVDIQCLILFYFLLVSKSLSLRGTHCSTFFKFCLVPYFFLLICSCDFDHL